MQAALHAAPTGTQHYHEPFLLCLPSAQKWSGFMVSLHYERSLGSSSVRPSHFLPHLSSPAPVCRGTALHVWSLAPLLLYPSCPDPKLRCRHHQLLLSTYFPKAETWLSQILALQAFLPPQMFFFLPCLSFKTYLKPSFPSLGSPWSHLGSVSVENPARQAKRVTGE